MRTTELLKKLEQLRNQKKERLIIIGISDKGNDFLFMKDVTSRCTDHTAYMSYQSIIDECKKYGCHKIIVAHNHPPDDYGVLVIEDVKPSDDDIEMTCELAQNLPDYGIILQDHFIVSKHLYLSMNSYFKTKQYPKSYIDLPARDGRKQLVITKQA